MNGPSSHPKAELEKIIVEHGGSVVQHPSGETLCVLAEKVAIKVRNLINKGIYNVVKVEWLLRCVEKKRFIPWWVIMLHCLELEAHFPVSCGICPTLVMINLSLRRLKFYSHFLLLSFLNLWHKEPRHQQQWYWPRLTSLFWFQHPKCYSLSLGSLLTNRL